MDSGFRRNDGRPATTRAVRACRYTLPVPPISAVLIALEEERHLAAALDSVRFCDERLVVDAGSKDRTREIAEAAGARVLVNAPWPGFVAQKRLATEAARHDWVLSLDADERVSAPLAEEIGALAGRGFDRGGYRIPRVAFYLGRWIRRTDWYPDPQLRLFDRRLGRWEGGLVHESFRIDGPVGRLRGEIEHFPYHDLSEHLRTIDRYTTLWARQAHEAGRTTGVAEAVAASTLVFLRNYLLRGGLLLGRVGLTVSALNAGYAFIKLTKLLELQRQARSR